MQKFCYIINVDIVFIQKVYIPGITQFDQAGIKMDNEKKLLRGTWKIMEQLLEVENLEEALVGSLDIIIDEIGAHAGIIWVLDEKTDRITPFYHRGPIDISGISVSNGNGIAGEVIKTGQPIVIKNAQEDPRFEKTIYDSNTFTTGALLCVPLNDLNRIIGCVQVMNDADGKTFDEEDLTICERMAYLSAMTIEEKGLTLESEDDKEVLVSLKDVIKEYHSPGRTSRVLKGISLDIYKGELLVVLGESGCGKSTMMNIIGGMDNLTEGTLLIEGKDYSHPTDEELTQFRRDYVGFIFQSFNLMPNLSAVENVRFISEISKEPISPEDALQQVGLLEKADNFPSQMSGGQQQRIAVARALVKNPKLILADEPTAALDHETSIEVLSAIEKVVRENNTTVIMVTHNPEIGKMADRVIRLRDGKVFSIKRNAHPLPARELEW